MNYNTETINEMALLLAEMMKAAITVQQKSEEKTNRIDQIETGMRDVLRQVGNQALGKLLSSLESTPNAEITCECGGRLYYQRMREAKIPMRLYGSIDAAKVRIEPRPKKNIRYFQHNVICSRNPCRNRFTFLGKANSNSKSEISSIARKHGFAVFFKPSTNKRMPGHKFEHW